MKDKFHEVTGWVPKANLDLKLIETLQFELKIKADVAKQFARFMEELAAKYKHMENDHSKYVTRKELNEEIDSIITGLKKVVVSIDEMAYSHEFLLDEYVYLASKHGPLNNPFLRPIQLDELDLFHKDHPFTGSAFSVMAERMLRGAEYYKQALAPPKRGEGKIQPNYAGVISELAEEFNKLFPQWKASTKKDGPFFKSVVFFLNELLNSDISDPGRHIEKALSRK